MKPMSDYTSGGNTSSDSTDSNQTTSDSDGSDSVDTPAASLQATPRPHATTIGVDEPPANGEDEDGDLYTLRIQSDRLSGGVYLQRADVLALADELQDATSARDGSSGDTRPDRDEHLGAVEIDVSSSVTAYHYDDEPDSLLLTVDDTTIRVSPEEARSLVGDVSAALDAIATERDADR